MPVRVFGYSSSSSLLGVLTLPTDASAGSTLSGSFAGASYFLVGSGSLNGNDNSLGWDALDYCDSRSGSRTGEPRDARGRNRAAGAPTSRQKVPGYS